MCFDVLSLWKFVLNPIGIVQGQNITIFATFYHKFWHFCQFFRFRPLEIFGLYVSLGHKKHEFTGICEKWNFEEFYKKYQLRIK